MATHGMYLSLSKATDDETTISSLVSNTGVAGVQLRLKWSEIETAKDTYTFTEIQAYLDECITLGTQLILMIEDKTFDGTDPIPTYMATDGPDAEYSATNNNSGYTGIRWRTYYGTRYAALIAALAAEFDSESNFEGICIQETATGFTGGQETTYGYTVALYVTALEGFLDECTTQFTSSETFIYANFISGGMNGTDDAVTGIVSYAVSVGAIPGGPDSLPGDNSLDATYRLYPALRTQRASTTFIANQNVSHAADGHSQNITAATQANPCVITATGHGYSNSDEVTLFSLGGMTQLNGNTYTVANRTNNTFELSGVNSTGFGAYTSGGRAVRAVPPSGTYWSPEELCRYNLYNLGTNYQIWNHTTTRADTSTSDGSYVWDDPVTLATLAYYGTHDVTLTDGARSYTVTRPAATPSAAVVTDVFYDLSLGSGGVGSPNDPYGAIASLTQASYTAHRFKRNTTHYLPAGNGIELDGAAYTHQEVCGYGAHTNYRDSWLGNARLGTETGLCRFDGSDLATGFTVSTGEVYSWDTSADRTTGGVFENGIPMVYKNWDTDIATTALARGEYCWDGVLDSGTPGTTIYVRCSDGAAPSTHTMRVFTTERGVRAATSTGLLVHDVMFTGCSRQGVNHTDCTDVVVHDTLIKWCGGAKSTNNRPLGGGMQCDNGADNIEWRDNYVYEVWDSPFSPQLFTASGTINDVRITGNRASGGALGGVEVATFSATPTVTNILIQHNYIDRMGAADTWAKTGDHVDSYRTNGILVWGNNAGMNGINILDNIINDCFYAAVNIDNTPAINVNVRRNKLSNARRGVVNVNTGSNAKKVSVEFNEIFDCTVAGIEHNDTAGTAAHVYRKNTIDNCVRNMLFINVDTTHPVISDNLLTNGLSGIYDNGTSDLTIVPTYNNCYNNTTNFDGVAQGNNNTLDPNYLVNGVSAYNLPNNSLVRGGGSGFAGWESELDTFGSLYATDDRGAHGGYLSPVVVSVHSSLGRPAVFRGVVG